MIRIGIIGIGFMGFTHFEAAKGLRGAKVAAICTRDAKKRAGDWTSIQGNFGPRGGHVDLSGIGVYDDYHEMLADPSIDMVDVCLPTNMHETVVLDSIAAGKPTLVEKPIAIDPKAAGRMVKAAEKNGVPLMVAHVLPFFPEFAYATDCIRSERYGKLLAAHFRRVITPPAWSSDMSDYHKLGGWGVDLHIHDNHFISHAVGVPDRVFSRGMLQDGLVNHVHTQYVYENHPDLAVTCVSGGIAAKGLAFAHGFELYFERATVLFEAGTLGGEWVVDRPLTLIADGKLRHPTLKAGTEWCSAFTAELQTAVKGLKSGEVPRILSASVAYDALKLCHAEAKSIASGKVVALG